MADMFEIKTYLGLVQDMTSWILANQDSITDFNEGSIIMSWIEAVSRVVSRLYMRGLAGFQNYNSRIPAVSFGLLQKVGQKASGQVTFSVDTAATSDILIPSGTLLQSVEGYLYETTEDITILTGNTSSSPGGVQAREVGTEYNVGAGQITTILDPVDADTVTNALSVTGGLAQESTEAYLQRFQEYTLGLGKASVPGQISVAKAVDGVNSAEIVEHFPPLAGYYNYTVYIEDGGGTASQALVDAVQLAIDGNSTTVAGTRGSGTKVQVASSTVLPVDVTLTILGSPGVDVSIITYLANQVIENYMNSLRIGAIFRINELINRIMDPPEVLDIVSITPSSNTEPASNQVVRPGTISISVTF